MQSCEPPGYGHPPPSYTDALDDLPPDYSTIAPFARQKDLVSDPAPARAATKSRSKPSTLLVDPASDVIIDFDSPAGVREHKKKKGGAKKAAPQPVQYTSNNDNNSDQAPEGGDDGQAGDDGGGAGDGNGDDGAGGGGGDDDDGWNDWATTGNKKKDKKKKKEEEEQKAKEEEEERQAAEAAAAGGGNNLSWADEAEGDGDDTWGGFATVGKKKKGKV